MAFLSGQNYGKLTHFERAGISRHNGKSAHLQVLHGIQRLSPYPKDLRDYHIPDELQVVYMQLQLGCTYLRAAFGVWTHQRGV